MAHRRSGFRGRGISESQRRKKVWIDMNVGLGIGLDISGGALLPPDLVAPGDSLAALVFPSSLNQSFAESTVLRIRGALDVPKSTYQASGAGNVIHAFGIGLVSEQASEVVSAIPNPATATGYDWDGWMFVRQSSASSLDANATVVDVKSMRKWRSGDSIVFVAGMATGIGGGAVGPEFGFSLRGLFLLP